MKSTAISQPLSNADVSGECSKWGCGDHGECLNGACMCETHWSGSNCQIAPGLTIPPPSSTGDVGCGNWDVYGVWTLGRPGYSPTCDCGTTGMTGTRCETECVTNSDCGVPGEAYAACLASGSETCGPPICSAVGRCECSRSCLSNFDCGADQCVDGVCTNGWTDVQCSRALDDTCGTDSDCGEGGSCVNGACSCEYGYSGLKCEFKLGGTGESCSFDAECMGAGDVCVTREFEMDRPCFSRGCETEFTGLTCGITGETCENDLDCSTACRDGACTLASAPPGDPTVLDTIDMLVDQIFTAEGLLQLGAEEAVEEAPFRLAKGLSTLHKAAMKRYAQRAVQRAASKQGGAGLANLVVKNTAKNTVKQVSTTFVNQAMKKSLTKIATTASSVFGWLYLFVQILGAVLDVDDAAGFNSQIPSDSVTLFMRKMVVMVNEIPELVDAGVHFPREYLPSESIEFNVQAGGEPMDDIRVQLAEEYLSKLVVNSNGDRIVRNWVSEEVEVAAPTRDSVLWPVSGKNTKVYDALSKWWWLIVVLTVVTVVTIGLGIGLSARRRP